MCVILRLRLAAIAQRVRSFAPGAQVSKRRGKLMLSVGACEILDQKKNRPQSLTPYPPTPGVGIVREA